MKDYTSPQLIRFGDIVDVTGVFGSSGMDDVFVAPSGTDISEAHDPGRPGGSTDACATSDLEICDIE
jgi:hypothetical protein